MASRHSAHTEQGTHAALDGTIPDTVEVAVTPRKSPKGKPSHDPQTPRLVHKGTAHAVPFNYEDSLMSISQKCDEMQQQMIVLRQELFQTRKELLKVQQGPVEHSSSIPVLQQPHAAPEAVSPPQRKPVESRRTETRHVEFHEHEAPDCQSDISSPEEGRNSTLDHIMTFSRKSSHRTERTADLAANYPCVSKYHSVYSHPKLHASAACRFCSKCHLYEKLFNQNTEDCGFAAHALSKTRLERNLAAKPAYLVEQALRRFSEYQAGVELDKTTFGDV